MKKSTTMRNIIFFGLVWLKLLHLASSGCVLHTYGDSVSSIICQELLETLENIQPLKNEGVLTINVTNSELPVLLSGSFDGFRELRRIFLPGNSIEEIEHGVFSSDNFKTNMPFLVIIDLSENNLETLPSEIFNHSSALELNLSSNSLKEIELGAFRNMPTLKKLDLSFNQISSPDEPNILPLGIFQDVPTLDQLNLSHNSLKTIRIGTFSLLPYLFVLDLSHNELTHLPGGVFTGSAIQELYLNDNNLVFFEYPNAKNIHAVINLVGNDFECNFLANAISKMQNGFFAKGGTLTEPNIYGIACKEDEEAEEEDENGDDVLEQIYILKYLSISTLCLGLVLACSIFLCQRNGEDDEPILKEISPLN